MSKKVMLILSVFISAAVISVVVISMASKNPPVEHVIENMPEVEEVVEDNVDEEVLAQDILVRKAVEMLYTISDPNYLIGTYGEINEAFNETGEITAGLTKGFNEICTEDGLEQIMSERMFLPYMEAAYFGQFTITVAQLSYETYFNSEGDGSILNPYDKIGYEYEVELLLEYTNGDSQTIEEEGYIHLGMIDNQWKVDQLSYKILNDVFMTQFRGE